MKRTEMTSQVTAELQHIPKWPGDQQKRLRALYNMSRRHSLGRNADREKNANEVLQECIEFMKQSSPNVEVHYDKDFFEGRVK
jgi:hypothetical protein